MSKLIEIGPLFYFFFRLRYFAIVFHWKRMNKLESSLMCGPSGLGTPNLSKKETRDYVPDAS